MNKALILLCANIILIPEMNMWGHWVNNIWRYHLRWIDWEAICEQRRCIGCVYIGWSGWVGVLWLWYKKVSFAGCSSFETAWLGVEWLDPIRAERCVCKNGAMCPLSNSSCVWVMSTGLNKTSVCWKKKVSSNQFQDTYSCVCVCTCAHTLQTWRP